MTRGAIEQPDSELGLQLTYQDTEAGRRDEKSPGRSGEASVLRDQQERPQLTRTEILH
jgi:hypothetical protein